MNRWKLADLFLVPGEGGTKKKISPYIWALKIGQHRVCFQSLSTLGSESMARPRHPQKSLFVERLGAMWRVFGGLWAGFGGLRGRWNQWFSCILSDKITFHLWKRQKSHMASRWLLLTARTMSLTLYGYTFIVLLALNMHTLRDYFFCPVAVCPSITLLVSNVWLSTSLVRL